ncbi:MAG: hypothetical protein A2X82_03095 [Geobacteraceae bacterium GWC2_55_20]|nr:MAG: hypothetical protein A2X82_03095 [Geobacteraceae bacterium GWC2_55_20]OGU18993.1 MAG: hypothetical protein A2X85_13130 [Geobacteraceae bacterium GWF2_54_21]HBA71955.1 hypothetical protein [Geobacter sp.]HCE69005.1 hypothetical protein [Geobacter sp.]
MNESGKNKFLVDAIQTAYLWRHSDFYGQHDAAIRALSKRHSAKGLNISECEQAFNLGLSVVIEAEDIINKMPNTKYPSETEARSVAAEIASNVQQSIPECPTEMVEYAIGMLFWMPLMR